MPHPHVSHRSEFGINLHERGLNRLSAGLRAARPDLFAFRTEIPIVPPAEGNPGHLLTLYAVLDEPLAFNLYPVTGIPAVVEDALFVAANILFTLTDSRLGAITRLRLRAECGAGIVRRGTALSIRLLDKPGGGPWFDIVSLEGEHPAALAAGGISADLTKLHGGDDELARSFRAIMNYLITLFLKEGLMRTVREFPLPSLEALIEAGPLGSIPGRDLYIRNDAIYLTLGNEVLGDGGFPVALPPADLTVGIHERGLQRVLDRMSPMPVPIEVGHDSTTLRLRSEDFRIQKIKADLRPGEDKLLGFVFFGGTLGLRLQFKAFGRWVRSPYLPIPIDASLSHYGGLILPYLALVAEGDGRLDLRLRPNTGFMEAWYAFVVTNYRGLFRDLMRRAVEAVKDSLVYKVFKKVPILGWILDKVLDITGEILGWALGAVLDAYMSYYLTLIINTVGRAVLHFMERQEFTVLEIEQAKVRAMTGLSIAGGAVRQVNDGRGGELQVALTLAEGTFPAPPPPLPAPPVPEPVPIPNLPNPDLPTLPEYPASAFEPALLLLAPAWPEGTEIFSLQVTGPRNLTGKIEVRYERAGDRRRVTKTTYLDGWLVPVSRAIAEYTEAGAPVSVDYQHELTEDGGAQLRQIVQFTSPGQVLVSHATAGGISLELAVPVLDVARMDFDEMWLFRLAYSGLEAPAAGVVGRIEMADALSIGNWARLIPVQINVTPSTLPDGTAALSLSSIDEDGKIAAVIVPGTGVVRAEIDSPEGRIVLERMPAR